MKQKALLICRWLAQNAAREAKKINYHSTKNYATTDFKSLKRLQSLTSRFKCIKNRIFKNYNCTQHIYCFYYTISTSFDCLVFLCRKFAVSKVRVARLQTNSRSRGQCAYFYDERPKY